MKYKLGQLIEQRREKNQGFNVPVRGVSREGFIAPKQEIADKSIYNVFYKNDFVFNPARMEVNSIALNTEIEKGICSSLYEVFYIKDKNIILPEYLNLFVKRDEFARQCEYIGVGSAREYCRVGDISNIEIEVPSIKEQQNAVNVWKSLKNISNENEAIAEPLEQLCKSYMQMLKHTTQMQMLGDFIEPTDERNSDLKIKLSQGISNMKEFQTPKQVAQNSKSDKIVRTGWFAYNRATTRNGEKISIAYREGPDCTVSSAYQTFVIKDESKLNPYFLWLWYKRPEFDRYARYKSKGSAHEFFDFDEMCRVKLPVPSIEQQNAIVSLFKCASKSRKIAEKAKQLSIDVCPALMQKAIRG